MAGSKKIFVIGTGRSGTHWLGQILQAHPDIHVTVEAPPIFAWSTAMALDPRQSPVLLPQLIRQYEIEHAAVAPRHYADKSHPNIWHAEDLAARLPDAVFLGIQRNPFATVASMLEHAGVLAWHERWREFPVPNRFLGITLENAAAGRQMRPPLAVSRGPHGCTPRGAGAPSARRPLRGSDPLNRERDIATCRLSSADDSDPAAPGQVGVARSLAACNARRRNQAGRIDYRNCP
jgi:hypothetical protein